MTATEATLHVLMLAAMKLGCPVWVDAHEVLAWLCPRSAGLQPSAQEGVALPKKCNSARILSLPCLPARARDQGASPDESRQRPRCPAVRRPLVRARADRGGAGGCPVISRVRRLGLDGRGRRRTAHSTRRVHRAPSTVAARLLPTAQRGEQIGRIHIERVCEPRQRTKRDAHSCAGARCARFRPPRATTSRCATRSSRNAFAQASCRSTSNCEPRVTVGTRCSVASSSSHTARRRTLW
jgi:hypothetical protein